ncbi:MAG: hypothetical protein KJ709_03015, partial [Nanoarchaeota archaeon]|nr:hypothetical protein [Nanoarchaeota archaeon]
NHTWRPYPTRQDLYNPARTTHDSAPREKEYLVGYTSTMSERRKIYPVDTKGFPALPPFFPDFVA